MKSDVNIENDNLDQRISLHLTEFEKRLSSVVDMFVPLTGNARIIQSDTRHRTSADDITSFHTIRAPFIKCGTMVLDQMAGLLIEHDIIALYGDGGMGKTACLERFVANCVHVYNEQDRVSLLVQLRRFKGGDLLNFLSQQSTDPNVNQLQAKDIELLAETGRLLLFIDGADEYESGITGLVNDLTQMIQSYPRLKMVISSRQEGPLSSICTGDIHIQPLNNRAQFDILRHSLHRADHPEPHITALNQTPDGREVANSPTSLSLYADLLSGSDGNIPREHVLLYKVLFAELFKREFTKKNSELLNLNQMGSLLGALARMAAACQYDFGGRLDIPNNNCKDALTGVCNTNVDDLLAILSKWPMFTQSYDKDWFGFRQKDFQEYFLAEFLRQRTHDELKKLRLVKRHVSPFTLRALFVLEGKDISDDLLNFCWHQNPLYTAFAFEDDERLALLPRDNQWNPWIRGVLCALQGDISIDHIPETTVIATLKDESLLHPPPELCTILQNKSLWVSAKRCTTTMNRLDRLKHLLTEVHEPWGDLLPLCLRHYHPWSEMVCSRIDNDSKYELLAITHMLIGDNVSHSTQDTCDNTPTARNRRDYYSLHAERIISTLNAVPLSFAIACANQSEFEHDSFYSLFPLSAIFGEEPLADSGTRLSTMSRRQWNLFWLTFHLKNSGKPLAINQSSPQVRSNDDTPWINEDPNLAAAACVLWSITNPWNVPRSLRLKWLTECTFTEALVLVDAGILHDDDIPEHRRTEWYQRVCADPLSNDQLVWVHSAGWHDLGKRVDSNHTELFEWEADSWDWGRLDSSRQDSLLCPTPIQIHLYGSEATGDLQWGIITGRIAPSILSVNAPPSLWSKIERLAVNDPCSAFLLVAFHGASRENYADQLDELKNRTSSPEIIEQLVTTGLCNAELLPVKIAIEFLNRAASKWASTGMKWTWNSLASLYIKKDRESIIGLSNIELAVLLVRDGLLTTNDFIERRDKWISTTQFIDLLMLQEIAMVSVTELWKIVVNINITKDVIKVLLNGDINSYIYPDNIPRNIKTLIANDSDPLQLTKLIDKGIIKADDVSSLRCRTFISACLANDLVRLLNSKVISVKEIVTEVEELYLLHEAITCGAKHAIQVLLNLGTIDIAAKDANGQTVLDIAKAQNNVEVSKSLSEFSTKQATLEESPPDKSVTFEDDKHATPPVRTKVAEQQQSTAIHFDHKNHSIRIVSKTQPRFISRDPVLCNFFRLLAGAHTVRPDQLASYDMLLELLFCEGHIEGQGMIALLSKRMSNNVSKEDIKLLTSKVDNIKKALKRKGVQWQSVFENCRKKGYVLAPLVTVKGLGSQSVHLGSSSQLDENRAY